MELQKLLDYDQWANERVFAAFEKVEDPEVLEELFKLFSHLLTAQIIWVSRILGEDGPSEIWPKLSRSEIKQLLKETPDKIQKLIALKEEVISYQNSRGDEFENKVQDILMHLIIHGQHHRAQMATLLRKAGARPPATDFIFFLRT